MKILVIDDNQNHLDAALQTLSGHEVTTCKSYDEALELLEEKFRDEKGEIHDYPKKGSQKMPYWDAVFCDLLMPAGQDRQGSKGDQYVGQEMPVGWSLALVAAKRGAKYVAVVSDLSHHDHPASAMLDRISHGVIQIEGAKALFTNIVRLVGIEGTGSPCPKCQGAGKYNRQDGRECECWDCSGTGMIYERKGKDWGDILDELLREE